MNWTHGLFRAWIVATVLIVAASTYNLVVFWPEFPQMQFRDDPSDPTPVVEVWTRYEKASAEHIKNNRPLHNYKIWQHLKVYAVRVVVLPLAIFLFGWAVLWIGRGFKFQRSD